MTRQKQFDPDVTRHDDGAYWAAALVLAIRAGDKARARTARHHLRRLGYALDVALGPDTKREVGCHVR
jgi:hypothetical protein